MVLPSALWVSVSIPWRVFGDSDDLGADAVEIKVQSRRFNTLAGVRGFGRFTMKALFLILLVLFVSIPWRVFGDSDIKRAVSPPQIVLGFNTLAGVRGFGRTAWAR